MNILDIRLTAMPFSGAASTTQTLAVSRHTIRLFSYFLMGYGLLVVVLAQTGAEIFEHLHLALDVSNGLLSLLLAVFLLAEQHRMEDRTRTMLAIAFGFAAGSELLHALVGVEWSGWMAWVSELSHSLRPATWPPSAYLLPIGLGFVYRQILGKNRFTPNVFIVGMSFIALLLFILAFLLPKYYDIGILGIQRPTQVPLLIILGVVIVAYWRIRDRHPLFEGIALMCVLLLLSDLLMVYSTSPHEKFTMMAHTGKLFAYAFLHTIQMRVAAEDSRARTTAEAALLRHQLELESLVEQRTLQLVQAKNAAEAATRAKSNFLGNISHEMRTPLHQALGLLTLIERGDSNSAQAANRRLQMRAALVRLENLIANVLAVVELESKNLKLQLEPINFKSLIDVVIETNQERAQQKNLALHALSQELPELLLGDKHLILLAINCYVNNALTFTEYGRVDIITEILENTPENSLLQVSVCDTGPGIALEILPKIFELFEQGDNSPTRKFGGTGLGLFLVKKLALELGGDAGCETVQGQGSKFWFTLRLAKTNAEKVYKDDWVI